MYKNNMYIGFLTTKAKWMMVVYNPKNDAWSNLGLSIKRIAFTRDGGRLIIADDFLFFVHVEHYYSTNATIISIFEMKIEDRLFIPITKFTCTHELFGRGFSHLNLIIGLGNKITMIRYRKDIGITFDVSTNEHQECRNNYVVECTDDFGMYHFKFTSVSP